MLPSTGAGVVVVGASVAGLHAAEALRDADYAVPVTVLEADPWPPCDRPPLSKQLLSGAWTREQALLRDAVALAGRGIEVRALGWTPSRRPWPPARGSCATTGSWSPRGRPPAASPERPPGRVSTRCGLRPTAWRCAATSRTARHQWSSARVSSEWRSRRRPAASGGRDRRRPAGGADAGGPGARCRTRPPATARRPRRRVPPGARRAGRARRVPDRGCRARRRFGRPRRRRPRRHRRPASYGLADRRRPRRLVGAHVRPVPRRRATYRGAGDVVDWYNPRYGRRMRVEHWTNAADRGARATRSTTTSSSPAADIVRTKDQVWQCRRSQMGRRSARCTRR